MRYADLQASRKTDALIAEGIMEWSECERKPLAGRDLDLAVWQGIPEPGTPAKPFPHYSGHLLHAWELVDKLSLFVGKFTEGKYVAFESMVGFQAGHEMYAPTPALAIVRMAAKLRKLRI